MRAKSDVEHFREEAERIHNLCPECGGNDIRCACYDRFTISVLAYEACIPKDFWTFTPKDVTHNVKPFETTVAPYCKRLKRARARGYGLVFLGDNGVGKTMFISLVLLQAIRRGFTTYYTTMLQLGHDIKRGFHSDEARERLDWMLTSDFVAIDEMGKERYKESQGGDHWMRAELERLFKSRCDDAMPMLLGSNLDLEKLAELYGPTFSSVLRGKYHPVMLGSGDFRSSLRDRMVDEMGYKKADKKPRATT